MSDNFQPDVRSGGVFQIGKVLRLRKLVGNAGKLSHGAKETPILLPEEQILWAEWPRMAAATSTAELNHAYIGDVLRPLLGDKHVDPGVRCVSLGTNEHLPLQ